MQCFVSSHKIFVLFSQIVVHVDYIHTKNKVHVKHFDPLSAKTPAQEEVHTKRNFQNQFIKLIQPANDQGHYF